MQPGVLDYAVALSVALKPGANKEPRREELQMRMDADGPSSGRGTQDAPAAERWATRAQSPGHSVRPTARGEDRDVGFSDAEGMREPQATDSGVDWDQVSVSFQAA